MARVFPVLGLFLLVTILATFFGLLAATANPVFVSVGAGLLVGTLLLAKPDWNIWIILVFGLLVTGLLPIWFDWLASKAVWGISLLGFILLLSAVFRAISVPETVRGTPIFVWLILVFMIFTLINSLAQSSSLYELASGFKRYFQVVSLLFALAWFGISERQIRRWRVFFIIVALVQLPWALYELIELVPIREAISYTYGIVPIDVVAGTFGAGIYSGGSNADMATFLIIVLTFLLAWRREKLIRFSRYQLLLLFVLPPLFMGETKVVIILLPLMFLTLYRHDLIARPHHALLMLTMGTLLTVTTGYAYLSFGKKEQSIDAKITATLDYNIYEKGYGSLSLNRTSVLTFWAEKQGIHDPISVVFGNGLGSSHDSTGGSMARRYQGYGISLTAISSLLWEQGLVGTVLFLAILAFARHTAGRLRRKAVKHWMRADAAAIEAILPLFAFYLFYRLTLLEALPFQIVFYSLLGYLAWLHRQHITDAAISEDA